MIADWDDAYAIAPHIPDGGGFPSRWTAAAFRAAERPEFVRQSRLIANVWTGLGADTALTVEAARHHFDVIDGLAGPASPLVRALVAEGAA